MKKITKTTLLLAFLFILVFSACQEEVIPQIDNQKLEVIDWIDSFDSYSSVGEKDTADFIR